MKPGPLESMFFHRRWNIRYLEDEEGDRLQPEMLVVEVATACRPRALGVVQLAPELANDRRAVAGAIRGARQAAAQFKATHKLP